MGARNHIDNRFKRLIWRTQHVHLAFLLWYCWWCSGGRHPPYWPPSPSAFSVSWKMIPAHWLNFIPSWPGPFCEGAINLGLNTTFVYYSGKALMTFMSMITTFFFFFFGGERMRNERPKFTVIRLTWAAQLICKCHVSYIRLTATDTYYCYYYILFIIIIIIIVIKSYLILCCYYYHCRCCSFAVLSKMP